jgi:ATP-binding cassette subfamily B (MDR/TAP) protein 1
MAYFDRPENSSSAISVRLSSDAAALEQMVGPRLGAICETVSLSLIGFILGIFFSWQLTMIVFLIFSIMGVTCYAFTRLIKHLNGQLGPTLENANRVRFDFRLYYFCI